jgi:hypothetical protein
MTNSWFPYLDPTLVEQINHRIDHPTAQDVIILGRGRKKRMLGSKAGFINGLWAGGGHRQTVYNHDMLFLQ